MWQTHFTKAFPCKIPLVGAPMAGMSGASLAAETCRAGALGFLAGAHLRDVSELEAEIDQFHKLNTDSEKYPLCIGFIGHSTFGSKEGWQRFEYILDKYRPDVVQFHAPAVSFVDPSARSISNIEMAHNYSAKVLAQVGTVKEARQALEAGADGIMAQGSEAGGHGIRRELGNGTLSLATNIIPLAAEYNVPVVAAGGIVNGRGLASVLALGCDGAVLGTRLWASVEAKGHLSLKQRLVETDSCDDVCRTTVFDQIQNSFSSTPWPEPFDSVGAVRNSTSADWEGRPAALALALQNEAFVEDYRRAQAAGDPDTCLLHAGEGVGVICDIGRAFDIIQEINDDAQRIVQSMPTLVSS